MRETEENDGIVLFTNEHKKGTTTIFLSDLYSQDDACKIKTLSNSYSSCCQQYKHEYTKMMKGVYSILNKMDLIKVFGSSCVKSHISGYKLFNKYIIASNQRKWRPLKQGKGHKTKWYPYGHAEQLMQYMGEDFGKHVEKQNTKYCNL
tara:strand:+ start:121 stop:564 length:444 start_codon:yes stop_codon:yes gene_type:complete